MAFSECEYGHIYDTTQYMSCPYCKNKEVRIEFGSSNETIGKTIPVSVGNDIGKTVPVSMGSDIGKTVPVSTGSDIGKTVPVSNSVGATTAATKVYGWLVSIEGADSGKDYKITSGNCSVGTGPDADITLSLPGVNYSGQLFRICFDKRGGQFYLVPNSGFTDIYIGKEPVYSQRLIPSGTFLEIGGCKYVFVSFCNENFSWD